MVSISDIFSHGHKWLPSFPPFLSLWHLFSHPSPLPSPMVCIWTTFIPTSSIWCSLVQLFLLLDFHYIPIFVYILQCFPFKSPESCLHLILAFVGMRDIRLITTSFPWNRCFCVNDHWRQSTVTFQVQGRITMWLILTQKWSEQKTPNLLSKLLYLLLFQRLLIQWHSFITCEL